MLVQILKPFPFSVDGIGIKQAVAGTVEDIPDGLIDGLKADMLIGAAIAVAPEPSGGHEPPKAVQAPQEHASAPEADCPLSNADLRDSIKSATGKAPGPRTSRESLIEQYRAITKAA